MCVWSQVGYLDQAKVSEIYAWSKVKPRRTSRTVRHSLKRWRREYPTMDSSRIQYRAVSPTHNIGLLQLGYIDEVTIPITDCTLASLHSSLTFALL